MCTRDAAGGGAARQLTVLTAHTKGLASLAEGQIEYMLMRRINGTDDQVGLYLDPFPFGHRHDT